MEFTKDIKFSGGLKENETTEITYSGDLYKGGSESVAIVYGFGENWDGTTEKEMEKTEGGFVTEIKMKENFDTFNFCFRNGNYEWDNNQSFNYISAIEPSTDLGVPNIQDFIEGTEDDFNPDLIIEILDNLLDETFSNTENIDKQQILDEILSENVTPVDNIDLIDDFDMDELVENILNPVVNCVITEEPKVDTVASESIKEEKIPDFTVIEDTTEDIVGGVVQEAITDAKETSTEESGLVPVPEDTFLVSPRKLRKFYLITKKIKLAIYKLVVAIPKLLSGNFGENKN